MAQHRNGLRNIDHPLIVGGGHSGLLLALALHRFGINVTLLDADPADRTLKAAFDGRALALMQGSKRVFDALDLWGAFESSATPIWGVQVQDTLTGGAIAYDAREVGHDAFGYGIETRLLRKHLLDLVLARSAINYRPATRLVDLERQQGSMTAWLDDGSVVKTPLVIGADGRRSSVRSLARIRTRTIPYEQVAITLAFRHEPSHEDRVREYMSEAGPLALLPIGDRICSATWIERPAAAKRLLSSEPDLLLEALRHRQRGGLNPLGILGAPQGFPLSAEIANRYAAPGVALVGDAAHGLHPIHAQGWNLGVRDVAALIEVLVDAKRCGLDFGAGEVLQRYARGREGDAGMTLGLTDGLNRLFSTDFVAARLLRHAGLSMLDQLPSVKGWVMRRGMGMSGDLPKLARGVTLEGEPRSLT